MGNIRRRVHSIGATALQRLFALSGYGRKNLNGRCHSGPLRTTVAVDAPQEIEERNSGRPEFEDTRDGDRSRLAGWVGYNEYIKSEEWANKRRQYFRSRHTNKRCLGCGIGSRLQLHHRTYERLGDEYLTDLVAVCEECHAAIHDGFDLQTGDLMQRTAEMLTALRAENGLLDRATKPNGNSVRKKRALDADR